MAERGTMTHRTPSLSQRVAVGLVVALVTLAGIWVTGGLLTNDFTLAMALTGVWMGLAAAGVLALAWRRPALRVPAIAGYLLVAVVVGGYLARSTLLDDEVNERVVRAGPSNSLLARGSFEPVAHSAEGTATTIRTASGERVLTLTNFEVDNGPDLRVYLVAGPARDESEVDDFRDIGGLKGNRGNQQYELPSGLDLERYSTVVIWCRAFSVHFARAPLT
jgi:hypothetical protein